MPKFCLRNGAALDSGHPLPLPMLLAAAAALALQLSAALATPGAAPPPPPLALSVWPQVSLHGNATGGTALAAASPALAIKCSSGGCPNTDQLAWYEQRLRADAPDELRSGSQHPTVAPTGGLVATISVSVAESAHTAMLPDTDESYSLACEEGAGDFGGDTAGGSCTVHSTSTTGALRGLETLAHLAQAQAIPVPLKLHDSPRFPYRECRLRAPHRTPPAPPALR